MAISKKYYLPISKKRTVLIEWASRGALRAGWDCAYIKETDELVFSTPENLPLHCREVLPLQKNEGLTIQGTVLPVLEQRLLALRESMLEKEFTSAPCASKVSSESELRLGALSRLFSSLSELALTYDELMRLEPEGPLSEWVSYTGRRRLRSRKAQSGN